MDHPEGVVCYPYERQCRLSCDQGNNGPDQKAKGKRGTQGAMDYGGRESEWGRNPETKTQAYYFQN